MTPFVLQLNYNRVVTEMFVRMVNNMLDEDLVAGQPQLIVAANGTIVIQQLYGMSPGNGGCLVTARHLGEDRWFVSADDFPADVEILGPQLNDFLHGQL